VNGAIASALDALQVSLADVAHVLGVSKSSLWSYYHQERAPSGEAIRRLGPLLQDRVTRLRASAQEVGTEIASGHWRMAFKPVNAPPVQLKSQDVEPIGSDSSSTVLFARALRALALSQVDCQRQIGWHRLALWRLRTGRTLPFRAQLVALEVGLLAHADTLSGIAEELSRIPTDVRQPRPARKPSARVRDLILRAIVVAGPVLEFEPAAHTVAALCQRTGLSRSTLNRAVAWLRAQPSPEIELALDHRLAPRACRQAEVWRLTTVGFAYCQSSIRTGIPITRLPVELSPIGAPPKLTAEQRDAVRAARMAGVPREIVSQAHGVSRDTITRYCKGLCPDSRGRRVRADARSAAIARLDAGAHVANVASVLGVQVRTVERWYDGRVVPTTDRLSAISDIGGGESAASVARRLGVHERAFTRWERCVDLQRRERTVAVRRVASGERIYTVARDLDRASRTVARWYDGQNLPAAARALAVERVVHGEPIGIVAAELDVPERAILRWHNATLGRDFRRETAIAWLAHGASPGTVSREFRISPATVRRLRNVAPRAESRSRVMCDDCESLASRSIEDASLSPPTRRVLADIAAAPDGRLISWGDRLEEWQVDAVLDLLMDGTIYRYAMRDGHTLQWVFGLLDPIEHSRRVESTPHIAGSDQ